MNDSSVRQLDKFHLALASFRAGYKATMSPRTWINASIYLGATVITSVLGLASALLMTHLLTPDQYGRIGVFLSALYIATPMVSLAAEGLVAVNKANLDEREYEEFQRTAVGIALAAWVALQLIATAAWTVHLTQDALLLVLPTFALLRFASTMAATEYVAEQRAATYAALTVLNSAVALALTYLILSQVTGSAGGRIAALMTAEVVLLGFRYRGRLRTLLRPRFHPKFCRQIVAFGLPSMVALLGAWSLNESDKTVVAQMFGLSTAGLYTAAATLATVMSSFNQSLTNALFPGLFVQLREKNQPLPILMRRYCVKFLSLSGLFAALVALVYTLTKDVLLPTKYATSSIYFYALVAASLSVAVYRPLGLIVEYFQLARARAIAIVSGGAITLLVSIGGTHILGTPLMAAAAIAAGYLTTAVLLFVAIVLHVNKEQPIAQNNHMRA